MPLLGVSIAVPEPWGSRLQDYRIRLGDATAVGIPSHITLLPPYDAPEGPLDDVVAHLESAAATAGPFDVRARGTGTFRPVSAVVFVNVVEGIAQCEELAGAINAGPLATRLRFPYHPHVTVAHDLPTAELDRAFEDLAGFDARFRVEEFWLYAHHPARGWQAQQSFALSGGA